MMPTGSVQRAPYGLKFIDMRWILMLVICMNVRPNVEGQVFFSDNIDLVGFSDAAWQIAEKDGNYYILTTSFCDLSQFECIGLIKLNNDFSVAWRKIIEKAGIDQFTSMAVTDSCVYLAGRLLQPPDSLEITVLKIDFDGNTVAQWYYGNALDNTSYGIAAAYGGGFAFLYNEVNQPAPRHTYMLRGDASGNILWQKAIEEQYASKRLYTIHASQDSAYVLGMYGCRNTSCTELEGFVLKIDDDGNEIFSVARDSTEDYWDGNTFATYTKDGGAVFSRLEEAQIGVWESQVLYRLDNTGNQLWEYHYDAGDYHRLWSIKEMRNGDILAVGFNENHPYIDTTDEYLRYWGGWLIRLSPTGEKKWERIIGDLRYPGDSFGEILDVVEADDGSLVAVGTIIDTFPNAIPAPYNRDVWLLHLDSMGCIHPGCTGIFQGITGTSKTINLSWEEADFSIFPNPAKDRVSVSLSSYTFFDDLTFIMTDQTGRIMIEKKWPPCQNKYILNTGLLPSGLYFITLVSRDGIYGTKKLFIQN